VITQIWEATTIKRIDPYIVSDGIVAD